MSKARDPFDVPLSDEQRTTLAHFLHEELDKGLNACASNEQEVDYWHRLYEQARTRSSRFPDAADLTSYLASEKVDAMAARIVKTIWVDPIWTVEGWGDAAERAPFVEEFHQWKAEEERLQGILDRLILIALIEPRGLLEVSEGTEMRISRKRVQAKLQTDPLTGGLIYDENMQPQMELGPDGKYVSPGPNDASGEVVVDESSRVRTGPVYRLLPYADSLITPGHARDKDEIWGYWKRFWRLSSELARQAKAGRYDEDAVARMSQQTDREGTPALNRAGQDVAPADLLYGEKELWEGVVLLDLNMLFDARNVGTLKGNAYADARWYLVTVHRPTQQLLRIQHDDLERSRFVPMILFPRPDRATEGYSLVGHKLITVLENHTAMLNMVADRSALATRSPIMRMQGALWDPLEQPFGVGAVIDIRQPGEVMPMPVPDVPASAVELIQMAERTADRIAGVNDIASGQVTSQSKTLGEIQMATEQSFVRMDLVVRRAQECLEDLAQIRHAIWKRTLAEQPEGMDVPSTLMDSLEGRGVKIDAFLPDKKVTAALLAGAFRFKPRGSVETANPMTQQQNLIGFLKILPMVMQEFPALASAFQNPQAGRSILRQVLRLFHIENTQAFLGSPAQDLQQTMLGGLPMLPGLGMGGPPGMPPGPPGMPPGMPPGGMPMNGGPPPGMPPGPAVTPPMAPQPPGVQ